ncbi:MAG: hypothetical protein K2I56_07255 [Muribaculaceae bacterium]|nr:hypothetical protein [Muribaculaceae bacterium]
MTKKTIRRIWQRLKAIRRLGKIEECRKQRIALEEYCARINEKYDEDYYDEDCDSFCSGGDLESDNSELLDEILTDSVCGSGPVVDEDKVNDWLVSYSLELDLARELELEGTVTLGRSGPKLLVFPFGFNPFTGREDWNYDGPREIPPGLLESYDSTFGMLFRTDPQKTLKLNWRDIYGLI